MECPHNLGRNYWGRLVNADKSPSPLFEQLCLGIAQLVAGFEPSSGTTDLTPDKLATFYREVGGNYDTLFLDTKGPALSFIYQSLGCFHTLRPTTNPFEPPSIPALLPVGFVRWQTIQLLLSPDEHCRYLQSAVSRWDVPNPNGGTFPKVIPREAFPAAPDLEMVEWHEKVSRCLERDYQTWHNRRHSPRDFVHYYSAASGGRDAWSPEADDFLQDGLYHRYGVRSRPRAESHDDLRAHRRRRSADGRVPWSSRFDQSFDNCTGRRRSGDSRASSPRPEPMFPPPPSRSKSMRMGSRERQATSSSRRHSRRFSFGPSSHSSDDEEEEIPVSSRRPSSTDDRRQGRHQRLSPARDRMPRRHSHDAPSAYRSSNGRDRDAYFSNSTRREHDSSRTHRYRSSKAKSDDLSSSSSSSSLPKSSRHSGAKFQEYIFDDARHSSWGHGHSYMYPPEHKIHIPRFQINSEGSSPIDVRRDSYSWSGSPWRGSNGSSGSERPRSSSNVGVGSAWCPRRDSPSFAGGKEFLYMNGR
ncbi:hypothetical protein VTN77DRAFT_6852 [Rasamsonia byssochlamydoides]|uniref:uncharacterized protein n=1 Tax=Rasamsonia byssochlamydoides TaxID=89139 RepID=UPI00374287AC